MQTEFANLRTEIAKTVADAEARTTKLIIAVAGASVAAIAAVAALYRIFG